MLHVPLPLPRHTHIIVIFRKCEPPQAVLVGETLYNTGAMFPQTKNRMSEVKECCSRDEL
jgi:hypothetical protein